MVFVNLVPIFAIAFAIRPVALYAVGREEALQLVQALGWCLGPEAGKNEQSREQDHPAQGDLIEEWMIHDVPSSPCL